MTGIILYGPPASGKSTITRTLTALDSRLQLLRRLKAGEGRRAEYRMTTYAHLQQLRSRGEILWENTAYSSVYAVDRPELSRLVEAGKVPVVHLGQPDAVKALLSCTSMAWLVVSLTCPRPVAMARIEARNTGDDSARRLTWDQTAPLAVTDLKIDTSAVTPEWAAALIRSAHQVIAGGASVRSVAPGR
ncbi:guanylate kinase [Nocardiopsis metallicus]|uniref:Guanylate kinase n=1 Tax=Nocardiopsis metallicus TaxID=179819 RepID=A0A840WFM4_9ACTN|nr:guanylate kinase [Nocardiopsis metallicus]